MTGIGPERIRVLIRDNRTSHFNQRSLVFLVFIAKVLLSSEQRLIDEHESKTFAGAGRGQPLTAFSGVLKQNGITRMLAAMSVLLVVPMDEAPGATRCGALLPKVLPPR